jgi:hypothetical protein
MKTTITAKMRSTKMYFFLMISALGLFNSMNAQCNANFTYTINSNGNVTFQSTSTNTTTNTQYFWSFGNSNFAYTANASTNYANNGFYTVCLFLNDSINNCSSSFCDTINVTSANNSTCNASFSYSIGTNGNVSFFNTSTGTSSNTVYYWSFNNSTTASGPNPTTTFTNYFNWVCLSIYDTVTFCNSSICDSVILSSNPCNTNVNFVMSQDSSQALTWWAIANYPQNVTNAVWSWGDNTTSTGLYPSHTYSASAFYNICVSITVSCAGTASYCANTFINRSSNAMYQVNVIGSTNQNPTSIITQEAEQLSELKLFPNPSKDFARLKLNSGKDGIVTLSIFEITGKLVSENKVSVTKGNNELEVDVNTLDKGFYLLNVQNGVNKKTIRLIKD